MPRSAGKTAHRSVEGERGVAEQVKDRQKLGRVAAPIWCASGGLTWLLWLRRVFALLTPAGLTV